MRYRIAEYIQPWEIDDFERQINKLILSSYHFPEDIQIIFDCTLNLSYNVVDWEKSKISKDYFLEKYKHIENILSNYFIVEFDTNELIQGCVDKRRSIISKQQDFVIWLDSDIYFSEFTLVYLINASLSINTDDTFIITPEITKYWDDSWDCITNEKFINEPTNHRDYFDVYSLDTLTRNNEVYIKKNNTVKFGGGWFNLFSNNIFEKISIPTEFGSYGWEDLYVMLCSAYLKIPQYILCGVVVSDAVKFTQTKNYLKNNLFIVKSPAESIMISQKEFNHIFSNFINNNKTNIL